MRLSDITIFDFKTCYNGDLTYLDGDDDKWNNLLLLWEERTKTQGANVVLELQKQIAIKENKIIILKNYLFLIQQAYESFVFSGDETWIETIDNYIKNIKEKGISFNPANDLGKEYNRCVKLINNKSNDIKQDLSLLKESTKGSMTFDKLIALVGKYSGSGIIKQKEINMDEFCEFYNLMISDNGK